jgi:hypothetical protein
MGVEPVIPEMSFMPVAELQLVTRRGAPDVNASSAEPANVLIPPSGIHYVKGPVTAVESGLDEREQYLVLLVRAVEERTDVTSLPEVRSSAGNGRRDV